MSMPAEDRALVTLGHWLRETGYHFVTPTPSTHRRVNARPAHAETTTLTGALGWSRPFRRGVLPAEAEQLLTEARALHEEDGLLRSSVRFSTLCLDASADPGRSAGRAPRSIYVHSAYPTRGADAVFFGPDTYRFTSLLRRTVTTVGRVVDIGSGSGAGGLSLLDRARRIVLADVNPAALRHARINTLLAGGHAEGVVETIHSDVLAGVEGAVDAVIANPPYLVDAERRLYRDGGGALGFDLSVRIVRESLARLAPGGLLVLYTGSPVVDGQHPLREALRPFLSARPGRHTWEELDPDVFGEELAEPAYQDVERVAVVALVAHVA